MTPTVAARVARLTATPGDAPALSATLRDFLAWVARQPRTYGETMAAWQSHCPRFTTWEDALADGLVHVVSAGATSMDAARVELTARGRALLSAV